VKKFKIKNLKLKKIAAGFDRELLNALRFVWR